MTRSQSIAPNDLTEQFRAASQGALLRFRIERHQAETKCPALVPLEVVGKRPVQIAAYVVALRDQSMQLAQGTHNQPGTKLVFGVGHAIFLSLIHISEPTRL